MLLNHKNIINVVPRNERSFNSRIQNFIFQIIHKQNSIQWCKFSPYLVPNLSKITTHLYLNVAKKHLRIRFILKIKHIVHWVFHHLMLNLRSTLHGLTKWAQWLFFILHPASLLTELALL